jgi:hypothetical protein
MHAFAVANLHACKNALCLGPKDGGFVSVLFQLILQSKTDS